MHYFVHSCFAIILKRKLFALLLLSDKRMVTINVLWLFLAVPWVGLQCVIVVQMYFLIILTYFLKTLLGRRFDVYSLRKFQRHDLYRSLKYEQRRNSTCL